MEKVYRGGRIDGWEITQDARGIRECECTREKPILGPKRERERDQARGDKERDDNLDSGC